MEEREHGPAQEVAAENARRKAEHVAARHPDQLVLGVDTVVSLDGTLYGKPGDTAGAQATLRALSGREHTVTSGICLVSRSGSRVATATTSVTFRALPQPLIEWYLASQEWHGRAGGYAIQGRGAALVSRIDGDYWNVVGLPVTTLLELEPALLPGA